MTQIQNTQNLKKLQKAGDGNIYVVGAKLARNGRKTAIYQSQILGISV